VHDADGGVELELSGSVLIQHHVIGCQFQVGDSFHGASRRGKGKTTAAARLRGGEARMRLSYQPTMTTALASRRLTRTVLMWMVTQLTTRPPAPA
jgi:hypothetical protein